MFSVPLRQITTRVGGMSGRQYRALLRRNFATCLIAVTNTFCFMLWLMTAELSTQLHNYRVITSSLCGLDLCISNLAALYSTARSKSVSPFAQTGAGNTGNTGASSAEEKDMAKRALAQMLDKERVDNNSKASEQATPSIDYNNQQLLSGAAQPGVSKIAEEDLHNEGDDESSFTKTHSAAARPSHYPGYHGGDSNVHTQQQQQPQQNASVLAVRGAGAEFAVDPSVAFSVDGAIGLGVVPEAAFAPNLQHPNRPGSAPNRRALGAAAAATLAHATSNSYNAAAAALFAHGGSLAPTTDSSSVVDMPN